MKTFDVLFNPLSNNGNGERDAKHLNVIFSGNILNYTDLTKIDDLVAYIAACENDIIIAGGDGTLNRFVNTVDCDALDREIWYYATGTGNDFLHDVNVTGTKKPIRIDGYLKNLPTVTVNGETKKFFNGVGFGIDGYCCEVADKIKAKDPGAKINYTAIAIKGLLFNYKSKKATVTVDGSTEVFENVWIASSMKGRYYGGGMMMAPDQDRSVPGEVSVVIYHAKSKMIALSTFPKIFEGKHVNSTDVVKIVKGSEVHVEFDAPSALQVDGETYLDVTEYSVKA